VNTKYSGSLFSYAGGHIDNFGTSINIGFDYKDCFSSIKEVAEATTFRRFIDAE